VVHGLPVSDRQSSRYFEIGHFTDFPIVLLINAKKKKIDIIKDITVQYYSFINKCKKKIDIIKDITVH
jgi:hypothetical protein